MRFSLYDVLLSFLRWYSKLVCHRFYIGLLIAIVFMIVTLIGLSKVQGSSLSMVFQFLPDGTMLVGPIGSIITSVVFMDPPQMLSSVVGFIPAIWSMIPWRSIGKLAGKLTISLGPIISSLLGMFSPALGGSGVEGLVRASTGGFSASSLMGQPNFMRQAGLRFTRAEEISSSSLVESLVNTLLNLAEGALPESLAKNDRILNTVFEYLNSDAWIPIVIDFLDLPAGTDVIGMFSTLIPAGEENSVNVAITADMKGAPKNFATLEGIKYIADYLDQLESLSYKCADSEPYRPGFLVRGVPEQQVCGYEVDGSEIYTEWSPIKHTSLLSLLGIWKKGKNVCNGTDPTCNKCDDDEELEWDLPSSDQEVANLLRCMQEGNVDSECMFTGRKVYLTGSHPNGTKFDHGLYIGGLETDSDGYITSIKAVKFNIYFSSPSIGSCVAAGTKNDKGKKPVIYPGFPNITNVDSLMSDVSLLYWCMLPIIICLVICTCKPTYHIPLARTRIVLDCYIGIIIVLAIGGGYSAVGYAGMESTSINLIGAFVVVGTGLDGFFVTNSHYAQACRRITTVVRKLAGCPRDEDEDLPEGARISPISSVVLNAIAKPEDFFCGETPSTIVSREEMAVRIKLTDMASLEAFPEAATTITIALATTMVSMFFMLSSEMPAMRAIAVQAGFSTLFIWVYILLLYFPAWAADNRRIARGQADISHTYYSKEDLEKSWTVTKQQLEDDLAQTKKSVASTILTALIKGVTTVPGSIITSLISVVLVGYGIYGWCGGVVVQTDETLIDYNDQPGVYYADILDKYFDRETTVEFLMSEPDLFDVDVRQQVRNIINAVRSDDSKVILYNPGGLWQPKQDSIICFLDEMDVQKNMTEVEFFKEVRNLFCSDSKHPSLAGQKWLQISQPLFYMKMAKTGDVDEMTDQLLRKAMRVTNSNIMGKVRALVGSVLGDIILDLVAVIVGAVGGSLVNVSAMSALTQSHELSLSLMSNTIGSIAPTYMAMQNMSFDPSLSLVASDVRRMRNKYGPQRMQQLDAFMSELLQGTTVEALTAGLEQVADIVVQSDSLSVSDSARGLYAVAGELVEYMQRGTCGYLENMEQIAKEKDYKFAYGMYPFLSTCRIRVKKTTDYKLYDKLNATVPIEFVEKHGQFGAFFSSYDFLLMLIDRSVPWQCISTAISIVALCAFCGVCFLSSWLVGLILAFGILLIQLSLLSGWAIFGYGLNMITLAAFILSAGMAIDYAFHISSSYLNAPYQADKRMRIVQGIGETGSAVFVGWFTSVVTMVPLVFSKLNTYNSFFICFFLVLIVSLYFAFCFMPVLLWWWAPNVDPRKNKKGKNKGKGKKASHHSSSCSSSDDGMTPRSARSVPHTPRSGTPHPPGTPRVRHRVRTPRAGSSHSDSGFQSSDGGEQIGLRLCDLNEFELHVYQTIAKVLRKQEALIRKERAVAEYKQQIEAERAHPAPVVVEEPAAEVAQANDTDLDNHSPENEHVVYEMV